MRLFNVSPLMSFNLALSSRHDPAHNFRFALLIRLDKMSFSKYT